VVKLRPKQRATLKAPSRLTAATDDLRARALRLLARREHSRQELATKLLSKPQANNSKQPADSWVDSSPQPTLEEVNALLDDLEKRRMLSDTRYAEMRARLRATRYGDRRLQQELVQKGIDRDTINTVLSEQPDELSRCRELWLKKFGQKASDVNERMKQTRYLANRGFSMRTIQLVLRSPETEDDLSNSVSV
jgi:regulatory protein